MNPKVRKAEITKRLSEAFNPETLGVEDESYMHKGHEGAQDGRSHFRVLIIADAFENRNLLDRHRSHHATIHQEHAVLFDRREGQRKSHRRPHVIGQTLYLLHPAEMRQVHVLR